jgi:glucose dehydrogenase
LRILKNIGTAALFSTLLISGFFGIFTGTSAVSAQGSPLAANWNGSEGVYGSNTNYSPQSTISTSNVNTLEPAWVWPVPVNSVFADQGVEVPPIIVNGVVYLLSQSQRIYALNLQTGAVVWEKDIPTTYNPATNVFDSHAGAGTI